MSESMMYNCVFCKSRHPMSSNERYVVYEDDDVLASHIVSSDTNIYLGHLVLHPRRHARGYAELTDKEARSVGLATARVSRALKDVTGAENVYAVFFGEAVPHLHVLLTSRYAGTPQEYWRINITDWPEAPRGDTQAVIQLSDNLRKELAS
jgi:histidine triad (HIT) family protein